ncbi:MAG: haloacid dehalogenase type II [Jatrophihabitans sp.]|uniref:haloacid dehalogenase type II n=1 Tax=Jatrophihabitans sp. TaxID=1932789 RepID=UPI003F7D218D
MTTSSTIVVFDVNETLSDLSALQPVFARAGLAPGTLPAWFAGTLRDGFALTQIGRARPFADVAADVLCGLVAGEVREVEPFVQEVLSEFRHLPLHDDVAPGVRALAAAGHRLATLSNGAASVAESLLGRADLRASFERILSVEDAGVWKPHADSYRYAVEELDASPRDVTLVAVHPWDLAGAAAAGLRTAWLDRRGTPWPRSFPPPEVTVRRIADLSR